MSNDHASLDNILDDFDPNSDDCDIRSGKPVSFWLPIQYKTAYAELQRKSGRRFSGRIRKLIMAAIDRTMAKAG
jgi:hypothetical protein